MGSQVTVGLARKYLSRHIDPHNENDPNFLIALNQISERVINDATWKGNVIEAFFETDTDGRICLPYHMDSIMAATKGGWPAPVYSEWHRWTEVGPGMILPEVQLGLPFFDLGDRFCTVQDIPVGSSGLLRTTITSSDDVGKINRYFGYDADGNDIVDSDGNLGEEVELAMPTVLTTNSFAKVTGVIKAASISRQTLAWMNGATPVTLSVYQPCETIPLYHRYQVGTVVENDTYGVQTIGVKGRRRFVPMVSENDFVYPPSINALKFGLLAWGCENAPSDNLRETAQNYWGDLFGILDKQHKTTRGSARRTINYSPRGAGIRPVRNST